MRWWPELPIGLVLAGLGLGANWLAPPGLPRQEWAGVFGVAAGLLIVCVRRFPWVVLVAECVLLVVADTVTPTGPDTAQVAAAVALGYLAYRAGRRATTAAFLLFFAVTIVNVVDPGNPGLLSGAEGAIRLVMLAGIAAAPVAFGRYVRGVRHATRVAEERAREAEARRCVETRAARLAERAGIARDLHDIVAHHIAAVALRAGSARFAVQHTGDTAEAVAALGEVRDTAGQVLDELRALLEVLRDPEAVESDGGQVEPEQMIRDAARLVRDAGVAVRVTVSDALATAPLVVRTTAARVVREGLTNSLKHAGPGAAASVDVRAGDGELVIEVRDSGPVRLRPALPPSGYGLSGMRERVGLLGGTLSAGATAGGGWCVRVRLPTRENM
ncbi:two-component sensor histidine kinase [Micromonospora endolithica]|uniref:histidine kinase n=2 Tax=Micromonospora endolithica TaxID=230091 RepID=A0A3A9Z3V7_9ACTN|nr:two-component sensor histidine kinase [Micromonospora endolithica]TWJ26216.1 signal transduction histidine kinase [Micromonospora endolithica]